MINLDVCTLIITGCISPYTEQNNLYVKNSKERLVQYIGSIEFYITKSLFKNIIFCESSAYDYEDKKRLLSLAESLGKKFEWISFKGSKNVIEKGKGYGEGEVIKYAFENSELICTSQFLIKVTGRLIISNINNIVRKMNNEIIYFNNDIYRSKGIDTRFYGCTCGFYCKNLRDLFKLSNEKLSEMTLEDVFYDYMHNAKIEYSCLPEYPRFIGVCGGNGKHYDKESKFKIGILSLLCRLHIMNCIYDIIAYVYRKIKVLRGYSGYRAERL